MFAFESEGEAGDVTPPGATYQSSLQVEMYNLGFTVWIHIYFAYGFRTLVGLTKHFNVTFIARIK